MSRTEQFFIALRMHFHRLPCIRNTPILNALTRKGVAEARQHEQSIVADSDERNTNALPSQGYVERVKALQKLKTSAERVAEREKAVVKSAALNPSELTVRVASQGRQYYARGERLLRKCIIQMETDQARKFQTPSELIYDIESLPYILDALNADGANIAYWPNTSSLLNAVSAMQERTTLGVRSRGILAQDGSNTIGHHLFCDVYVEGGKASLIMLDAVRPSGIDGKLFDEFDSSKGRVVASYWDMKTQNSPKNCIFFALSYAKKAIDEKDFLLALHQMQINNKPISAKPIWKRDVTNRSIWVASSQRSSRALTPEERSKHVIHYSLQGGGNLRVIGEGMEVFPARFFKHAESRTTVERLKQMQPNLHLETKGINKKNQTIFQRWDAYKTTRSICKKIKNSNAYEVHQQIFSRSIEDKRLSFLRIALDHVLKTKRALGIALDVDAQPALKKRVTFAV